VTSDCLNGNETAACTYKGLPIYGPVVRLCLLKHSLTQHVLCKIVLINIRVKHKGDESSSTIILLSRGKRPQYWLNKKLDGSGEEKIS